MLGLRFAARAGILAAAAVGALALAPPGAAEPLSGVAALQVALHSRGLYPAAIDGFLGPKTMAAVRAFQRKKHLLVDGIPGPKTWAALGRYSRYRLGGRVLVPGDSGWDVSEAQFLLRIHGFEPGPLDGFMGTRSEEAVRRFQRATGLHVDGVIGPATTALAGHPAPGGAERALAPGRKTRHPRGPAGHRASRRPPALLLPPRSPDQSLHRGDRKPAHPVATREVPGRRKVPPPLVVPARLQLGPPSEADTAWAGKPAGHAMDGHLFAGRGNARDTRSGVSRLFRVAWLHPPEHSRRRGALPAGPGRNPSLDLLRERNLRRRPAVVETWRSWPRGSS